MIPNDWKTYIDKEKVEVIINRIAEDTNSGFTVCPPLPSVFKALSLTSPKEVKVVILGEEPYPDINHADGLAFSSCNREKAPKELLNIFKEIENDVYYGVVFEKDYRLDCIAEQGVLLLNSVLSGIDRLPHAHRGIGWEEITDELIKKLSDYKENLIFVLWGAESLKKKELINGEKHYVLTAGHPRNPDSGFKGCHHFSEINDILFALGKVPIEW